uniref:Uncharacterized protein n=1 Tax=Magallana gigas TaxID=29159 RepID=A0A8W8JVK9_MAGGI|nr:cell death abnormality protein 1-like [Crassostrea gigas]
MIGNRKKSKFMWLLHVIVALMCNVRGCEVGYYGYNCTDPCRYPSFGYRCQNVCNCTQDMCDHKTGCSLPQICNVGYYGPGCISPCRYPGYGRKCQMQCSCELIDCNHIQGCPLTTERTTERTTEKTTERTTEKTTERTTPDEGWQEGKQLINIIIVIGNFVLFTVIGLSITYYSRKYRLKRKQTRKRTNTEL